MSKTTGTGSPPIQDVLSASANAKGEGAPTLAPRRQHLARLVEKNEVAPGHFEYRFSAQDIGHGVRPGQFVHVLCREEGGSTDPLLRRAFSIMRWDEHEISILFRVQGKGTLWLSRVEVEEHVDILGPLGQPFDTDIAAHSHIFYVGGGVGVPPMVALASHVSRETMRLETPNATAREYHAIVGARSASGLLGLQDFQSLQVNTVAVTEDGSSGVKGRVTDVLRPQLSTLVETGQHGEAMVYTCGPLPMLRAVAALCHELGVACQVSLEENMPCGVGVCNGCVVPVVDSTHGESGAYERYQRICIQGPVMNSRLVDWEALCH